MNIPVSAYRAVQNLHTEHAADFAVLPGLNNPQTIVTSKGVSLFELLLSEQLGSAEHATAAAPSQKGGSSERNGLAEISHEAGSYALQSRLAASTHTSATNSWLKFTSSATSTDVRPAMRETPTTTGSNFASGEKVQASPGTPGETAPNAEIQTAKPNSSSISDITSPNVSAPVAANTGIDSAQPQLDLAPMSAAAIAARVMVQQFSRTVTADLTNLVFKSMSLETVTTGDAQRPPASAIFATTHSSHQSTESLPAANRDRPNADSTAHAPRTEVGSELGHRSSTSAETEQANIHVNETLTQVGMGLPTTSISRPATFNSDKSFAEQLTAAISQFVDGESHGGSTNVQVQLDIPELGTVNLLISLTDKVISLRIVTENEQAQKIVEAQISDLRQSLTNRGIGCGQFQVGFNSDLQTRTRQTAASRSNTPAHQSKSTQWNESRPSPRSASRLNGLFDFVA